ncbi:hypothetical protein MJO28_004309 [Puccinia striiformis f. sp. tritici]|uniref:Uncharacterized protein n=1 Tax=Puccinia striiformis f. sp. tritici TaxID=168172 RepID=A0ACC0ENK3_9BASI|nr:hypothetical protein MJO28_004309 [Puccinia striiformis f. sp. tritici]
MATAPSPDQSFPPNPSLPQNETAPDSQRDTGDAIATSALDTLKGPAPSLEAYANFNSSSPPTLLRSERRQAGKQEYVTSCSKLEEILEQALGLSASIPVPPATIISGLREMHEQCQKRKQDVSEGKPIPPEDLIDLTNEPDEENDMEKFTQGFSSSKRRRVEDNKLSDEKTVSIQLPTKPSDDSPPLGEHNQQDLSAKKDVVHSPIGHTSPPATQDTAGVPPDPAGSSTSASLTSTGLEVASTPLLLISAGQGADTATSLSSSTGPGILINPAPSSSTAPDVNPSSLSQPGSNSTGPVGVTNHPDGLAPPPPPPPIIILKPASSADPNANPAATADPNTTPSTPPPPPSTPSLILNDSVRAEVHTILETFQGHLNRQKFNQAYLAVHAFIDCRAKTMHKRTPPPELPQFALVQSESSHSAWLKDIQKYLDTILLPSHDEPWYSPRLIDLSNLKSADPAALKTQGHVEYPLALLLVEIQKPSKFILSRWSNCIASSIQLTAQDHAVKPSSLSDLNNDNLDSHLRILEYLNSCKTSSSPSNPEDGKLRNDMTLKPLYQLHDLIIDIFITYSIIRGSAVADVEPDATSAESQALVVQKKELDKHRSRHNYTPFCLYLVAGVCGLILAPTNRQFASGASALGFLTAVQHIFIKNIPRHEGLEPVWKRLGAYIDNLFIDSFLTPNCLFNFRQPQIIPLAQAITSDFLACVQNQFPAQNFKLPRAVTAK